MDIRPIKNEADYEAALEEIERLLDADPNTPEGNKLEILMVLVEAYEDEHYSIPLPNPIAAIKYHMESRGLSRKDLEPYVGSRARVSEILNRKRRLSLNMIRRLSSGLGIPVEILIQPYDLALAEKAVDASVGTELEECETERVMAHKARVISQEDAPPARQEIVVIYMSNAGMGHKQTLPQPSERCIYAFDSTTNAMTTFSEERLH
jgi:HTH-type transcriptional regulator/antitoxin HigA